MIGFGADYIDSKVDEKYECIKKIGRGIYGIVWQARDRENAKLGVVAVKRIFNAFATKVDAKRTYRELMYLSYFCDHPNIVTLHDVLAGENDMDLYMVLENMDTDLASIIHSGVQPIHSQYIAWQILRALKYIHSGQVVHRDIKPSNILLNSRCEVRICDFGLARSTKFHTIDEWGPLPKEDKASLGKRTIFENAKVHTFEDPLVELVLTPYCSSRWYRSPEQLVNADNYSTAIDMWALGCVLGEMAIHKPIFPGVCTLSQLSMILHLTGRPSDTDLSAIRSHYVVQILEGLGRSTPSHISDILPGVSSIELIDLVGLLLQFNPDKRLTAVEALEHPYVGHFHHPDVEGSHSIPDIVLPLSDDIQYHVSAYRDRIYADVLGIDSSIARVNKDRRINMELAGERESDTIVKRSGAAILRN